METKLIIIIAVLLVIVGFLVSRSPKIVVQESTKNWETKIDSLETEIAEWENWYQQDSTERITENQTIQKAITTREKEISRLKAKLAFLDVPDSEPFTIQTEVIGLQDEQITELKQRIFNDSLYIQRTEANFKARLAVQAEQINVLETALVDRESENKELRKALKREKRKSILKGGTIGIVIGVVISIL